MRCEDVDRLEPYILRILPEIVVVGCVEHAGEAEEVIGEDRARCAALTVIGDDLPLQRYRAVAIAAHEELVDAGAEDIGLGGAGRALGLGNRGHAEERGEGERRQCEAGKAGHASFPKDRRHGRRSAVPAATGEAPMTAFVMRSGRFAPEGRFP